MAVQLSSRALQHGNEDPKTTTSQFQRALKNSKYGLKATAAALVEYEEARVLEKRFKGIL